MDQASAQSAPAATQSTSGPTTLSFEQVLDRDIFDLLGLGKLAEKDRAEIQEVMEETIKNRIIARIVDSFSDEEIETWNSLADAGVNKQMVFLDQHKQQLERLALEEALIYKYEIAQLVDVLRTGTGHSSGVGSDSPEVGLPSSSPATQRAV